MEDHKCFCLSHNKEYAQYCDTCEQAFCVDCPPHYKEHPIVPLLSVIGPEIFAQYLKDTTKTINIINWALIFLSQMVEKLMDPSKAIENDVYNPLADIREDFTSKAKNEEQKNKKMQALAIVTGKYESIKNRLNECLEKLESVKESVNARYEGKVEKAYEVLMILRGVPQTLNTCMTEAGELEGRVEDTTSINILDEIWLINTFKKLDEYIKDIEELIPNLKKLTTNKIYEYQDTIPKLTLEVMKYEELSKVSDKISKSVKILGEKRIREIDIAVDKLEREILKLQYSVNTPEENIKKSKEKEDELETTQGNLAILQNIYNKSKTKIDSIPKKLQEANEKLGNIMKKRMTVLEDATRYLERAKSNKEWILKMLLAKKSEIETEFKSLILYKDVDAILILNLTEKKIILNQATKRLDQIKNQYDKLTTQIFSKKAEIERIGEYFKTVKNGCDEFQLVVNELNLKEITQTLGEVEKSKNDIEESKKVNSMQLLNIVNTLMAVEGNIEQGIIKGEEEFKDCLAIPPELENSVKELVECAMTKITKAKDYLEKEFNKVGTFYPMCDDGRPGKVMLTCGHWMCYNCFFKGKDKTDERLIACTSCGGIKQKIGIFFNYQIDYIVLMCGCKKILEATVNNKQLADIKGAITEGTVMLRNSCDKCKRVVDPVDYLAASGEIGISIGKI